MKKTSLLALSLFGPFAVLTPVRAAETETPPTKSEKSAKTGLAKLFEGKLVDAKGAPVDTQNLAEAKYVAVYFSAHWCPPCRKFTPELVRFAKSNKKNGLEVVFVSSDKSKDAMLGYMKETGMPWGGVMNREAPTQNLGPAVNGIPHLRVFDPEGKIVIDTDYDKGVYPTTVLAELKKKLK